MRFSLLILFAALCAAVLQYGCSSTQRLPATHTSRLPQDEFSELDDAQPDTASAPAPSEDDVAAALERARHFYSLALRERSRCDSTDCERDFESAIAALNSLASYPSIENDSAFMALSTALVRDYEHYVCSISTLPPQSPIYIFRDKLAQEVEALPFKPAKPVPVPNQPRTLAIPMPQNEYVQKNIEFLTTGKGAAFMRRVLARSGKYFPMISRIFKEEGVPDELKYLALIESGLDPNIVSWANAVGMWQFIQKAGALYGLSVNRWVDERRDPEKATRAAARYLRDVYNRLHDWQCAIASYDCGVQRVIKSRLAVGDTNADFWAIRDYLPRETKNYVPLYIAAATIAMNPALYGFTNIERENPWKYDTVHVDEAVNLNALAACAGCTADDIASLNPELMQPCTPPGDSSYALRLPSGAAKDFHTLFAQLTDADKQVTLTHIVRRYESLRSIAAAYGLPAQALAAYNGVNQYRRLRRGVALRIPLGGAALARLSDVSTGSDERANAHTAERRIVHRVRRGETLASIASRYHVSLAELRRWNHLPRRSNAVRAGVRLALYVHGTERAQTRRTVKRWLAYRVRRGDTMAKIADAYNVSLRELRIWNRGKSARSGAKLRIYTDIAAAQPAVVGRYKIHRVRRGETLAQIAGAYGVAESDLKEWNGLHNSLIHTGERLRLYVTSEAAKGDYGALDAGSPGVYRVRSGDTLERIARKFGVTLRRLKELNPRANDRTLRIGQKIIL